MFNHRRHLFKGILDAFLMSSKPYTQVQVSIRLNAWCTCFTSAIVQLWFSDIWLARCPCLPEERWMMLLGKCDSESQTAATGEEPLGVWCWRVVLSPHMVQGAAHLHNRMVTEWWHGRHWHGKLTFSTNAWQAAYRIGWGGGGACSAQSTQAKRHDNW